MGKIKKERKGTREADLGGAKEGLGSERERERDFWWDEGKRGIRNVGGLAIHRGEDDGN